MGALNKQVAGNHYKNQKVQPIELAYMLGQTPAFCKVCKYATRIKDDPVQQLNKALHCIELDEELLQHHTKYKKEEDGAAWEYIDTFTDDDLLRACLKAMHSADFPAAKLFMKKMIWAVENTKWST